MAKPKRPSETLASSEKDADTTTITATPPYSSKGPTLPIIGAPENDAKPGDKRKATDGASSPLTKKPHQPPARQPTLHPSLYEPWTRLPPTLLHQPSTQTRLQPPLNIIPVVFSKNQNIKSGLNRLKTYLGASQDPSPPSTLPDALARDDVIIAVSAQGQGTIKLVGIVDMLRRIVAPPSEEVRGPGARVETWSMYTMLWSVEVESKNVGARGNVALKQEEEGDEEEAFEAVGAEGGARRARKVPVLTVWLARREIAGFKSVFGEQRFAVQRVREED